jgi:hypothetical protein
MKSRPTPQSRSSRGLADGVLKRMLAEVEAPFD